MRYQKYDRFKMLSRSRILALVALVGILACIAGLSIDTGSFALSLLASLAGFSLATFAAVFFFDELAEQASEIRRRKKWAQVRVTTLTLIWDRVQRMTLPVAIGSPQENTAAVVYVTALKLMEDVANWIPSRAENERLDRDAVDSSKRYDEQKAGMASLHEEVFNEYVYIRDVLTPKVLELADDLTLIELLVDLDDAERSWSDSVFIARVGETQVDWQNFAVSAWSALHSFYTAAIRVARHVALAPDMPPPRPIALTQVIKADGKHTVRSRTMRDGTK